MSSLKLEGDSLARFSLNSGSIKAPLEDLITAGASAGFGWIELWSRDFSADRSPQSIAGLLRAKQMKVSAFQLLRDFEGAPTSLRADRFAEAERLFGQMSEIGADLLLVCANTAADCSGDRTTIARDLRQLADMAQARNMRISLEPLAWSRWMNTYEQALACVEHVNHPALGLTIDMFHWFWGGTPVAFIDQVPMARCFGVQLCDAALAGLSAIETARKHRLFPGQGSWPVADLAARIRKAGYTGFYNLEVFNVDYLDMSATDFVAMATSSIASIWND